MPLINTATKIYKGATPAVKVYRGTVLVWPPAPAFGPPQSAYTSQIPTINSSPGAASVGNDFTFAAAGRITGMRYYTLATTISTGDRILRLWNTTTAALIDSITPTGGTLTAQWRSFTFPSPVAVAAGQTIRVVIECTGVGGMARSPNFAANVVSGDITMNKQGLSGAPGVYPATNSANTYFVDVVFEKAL